MSGTYVNFCGNDQRQKYNMLLLVAVHAYCGCTPEVHQSSERCHLRFAFVFVWTNTPILFSSIWSYKQYQVGSNISCTNKFQQGNHVVMGSDGRFNQVDPDHSQEWLNGARKRAGRIVGITTKKHSQPLSRRALSYNVRSQIAAATRKMSAFVLGDHMNRNESTTARTRRDHNDECQVIQCLYRFKVFSTNSPIDTLHNIATMNAVFSRNIHFVKIWKFA